LAVTTTLVSASTNSGKSLGSMAAISKMAAIFFSAAARLVLNRLNAAAAGTDFKRSHPTLWSWIDLQVLCNWAAVFRLRGWLAQAERVYPQLLQPDRRNFLAYRILDILRSQQGPWRRVASYRHSAPDQAEFARSAFQLRQCPDSPWQNIEAANLHMSSIAQRRQVAGGFSIKNDSLQTFTHVD
jgi:hypothetical protein